MNRWIDNNGMNSFFPAAVRVGYEPEVILKNLRRYVTRYANTNGFAKDNPHGIENCSIVPNTINEMLCMGHKGVIRVFPVWPRDRDAKFHQLRTWGAFLVSSELKGGDVSYVQLLSERGRDCVVQNPWPGQEVHIARDGQETGILKGERLQFSTKEGEYILLVPVK